MKIVIDIPEEIMEYVKNNGCLSVIYDDEVAKAIINGTPYEDRPQGKWITWEEAGNYIASPNRHECSCCHDSAQVLVNGIELLSDFCPNCGADMRGEADNLCDNCKLADTCTASLKGCIGCKTTKCFRHEWAKKEEENEQTTD